MVVSPPVDRKQALARIGYARCSTEEQAKDSNAMDYQASRLEEHCGVGNVIRDFRSASKVPLRKREAFQEAIARLLALPRGTRRVLMVTRLDRLSRRIEDIQYMKELMQQGIEFDSLDSGGVEGGAMGTFSLTMRLAMAEYEAMLLSEKIEHRYDDRRKASQPMNRAPFGYRLQKQRLEVGVDLRLVPDPVQAPQALAIYQSVIANEGVLSAVLRDCRFQKMPRSDRGLKLWLQNRVNLGHTIYHRADGSTDERLNTHEALVSEELFLQVQTLLCARYRPSGTKRPEAPVHPLSGIVRCPACGYTASFSTRLYRCTGSSLGRYRREAGEVRVKHSCECRRVRKGDCPGGFGAALGKASIEALYEQVVRELCAKADQIANGAVLDRGEAVDPEELALQQQLEQMKRLGGTAMQPVIKAAEEQLEQLRLKREGLSAQRCHRSSALSALNLTPAAFRNCPPQMQNDILRQFVLQAIPAHGDQPAAVELAL